MRFNEFSLLSEDNGQPGYFTIGDSHAKGVADGAGRPWVNLAIGGRQANDPGVRANVARITPGSIVVVAAGANDTANSYKSANKDPKKVVPPETIAGRVASLVDLVRAQKPSKVILLVFPNGEGRTVGMAQWYNGDYQEQVRSAIKRSVKADEVIDQSKYPISNDNIHLVWSAYGQIGKEIASKYTLGAATKISLGRKDAEPGAPATKEKDSDSKYKSTPGFNPRVLALQKALKAKGANLGPFGPDNDGLDGLMGKYTRNAAKEHPDIANKFKDVLAQPDAPSATGAKDPELEKAKAKLNDLHPDAAKAVGRRYAEKFLGRDMSDKEWDLLLRATFAEASPNTKEQGYVMAVILNRARSGRYGGNGIDNVLYAKNQFQAVTGTRADGHQPSKGFVQGPQGNSLNSILAAAAKVLPEAPKDIYKFTAADPRAYGPGTNIGYLHQLKQQGGVQIGGTIFA